MRVFLDANILFSAAKSDGAVRRLLTCLCDAGHECWVDDFVLAEAQRNLASKAPSGLAALEDLLPRLQKATGFRTPDREVEAELPVSDKDRPVLAAAIHCQCHVLVTGDRAHFGHLYGRTLHGATIHSPRSLAELLVGWPKGPS